MPRGTSCDCRSLADYLASTQSRCLDKCMYVPNAAECLEACLFTAERQEKRVQYIECGCDEAYAPL